jgi:hypothetical protein
LICLLIFADNGYERGNTRYNGPAEEGSVDRPGKSTSVPLKKDALEQIDRLIANLPDATKVCRIALEGRNSGVCIDIFSTMICI